MTFKTLSYFCEACKDLQFSETARRLFITPQSLSKAIRSIEDEFKCSLFLRASAGLHLTSEGVYLLEQSTKILSSLQEMRDTLAARPTEHTLTINLTPGVHAVLPDLLPDSFQGRTILYRELAASACLENVRAGLATAAISICPPSGNSFKHRWLWSSPLCAVVNAHNPLALKETLTLNQLQTQSLITVDAYMDSYRYMTSQLEQAGFDFPSRISAPTPFDALNLCQRNLGVALFPERYLAHFHIARPDIKIIPIHSDLLWEFYFITSPRLGDSLNNSLYAFLSSFIRSQKDPSVLSEIGSFATIP